MVVEKGPLRTKLFWNVLYCKKLGESADRNLERVEDGELGAVVPGAVQDWCGKNWIYQILEVKLGVVLAC